MLIKNQLNKFKLSDFQVKVLLKIKSIPRGRVTTYQILAKAISRPKAMRAVANALNINPLIVELPCHRVVRSGGQVGGYVKGVKNKIAILKKEGVDVRQGRVVNFEKKLYHFN